MYNLKQKSCLISLSFFSYKEYQSLVGSVVIGAELGREDHGSIPRNCDRECSGTT
jgi:hypothetical protein